MAFTTQRCEKAVCIVVAMFSTPENLDETTGDRLDDLDLFDHIVGRMTAGTSVVEGTTMEPRIFANHNRAQSCDFYSYRASREKLQPAWKAA